MLFLNSKKTCEDKFGLQMMYRKVAGYKFIAEYQVV